MCFTARLIFDVIGAVNTASHVVETADVIVDKVHDYPVDEKIESIGGYLSGASVNLASGAKAIAGRAEYLKIGSMEIRFATGKGKVKHD